MNLFHVITLSTLLGMLTAVAARQQQTTPCCLDEGVW